MSDSQATSPPAALTVRIRPRTGWMRLNIAELWSYRELGYFLVWRDVKVRYKQTVFGALWAVMQPVLLMVAFSLFLGQVAGIAPTDVPYPLFALAGLVPWTFFSQSLARSSESLVNAANLIQKVYFPRLLLPIAATASFLLDFAIAMGVLGIMMIFSGVSVTASVLWIPLIVVLAMVTTLAIGTWLSAMNVKYRDIRHAVPFLLQAWLFLSPVAYSGDLVPDDLKVAYHLNPMTGVLEAFRWALLGGGDPPIGSVIISAAVSGTLLVTGITYFRRVERTFADVI